LAGEGGLPFRLDRLHLVEMAARVLGQEIQPLIDVQTAALVDRHPDLVERSLPPPEPFQDLEAFPEWLVNVMCSRTSSIDHPPLPGL
jgi:hypothetical protein